MYTAPSYGLSAGAIGEFRNDDAATHDVAAVAKGPDGKPLFRANQIRSGTTPVDGTQYLSPGDYRFFCTIHGASVMSATLTIQAGTAPQARPQVDLIIPQQALGKVVSSGRLSVLVKARTASSRVALKVSKGKRRLGTLPKLSFAAGSSRTVRVPLTTSGKKALDGLDTATLAVDATVPFGKPDRASRKLK